jgi:hypothetical protein
MRKFEGEIAMTTPVTDELYSLGFANQVKDIHKSKQYFLQKISNFVILLQSRRLLGRAQYRIIPYCLESGKRKILEGSEADILVELLHDHPVHIDCRKDDGYVGLRNALSGSQSKANVYRPLNTEATPNHYDELIKRLTDQFRFVNELESVLQQEWETYWQTNSRTRETCGLPTEDESKKSTSDKLEFTRPESNSDEGAKEIIRRTSENVVLSEQANFRDDESPEPLKLKITQIRIYLLLEQDKSQEPNDKSLATEASGIEEDNQKQIIVVDAAKRVLMGELPKSTPLDLEVIFQLKGEGALELTQHPLPYYAEVYGENRNTRKKLTLGQAPIGNLVDGELTYTCRLANMRLSNAGTYRLQFFTRLDDVSVSPDLLELPFVQVA